jgi:peptidyl-dipeptidase Dcp
MLKLFCLILLLGLSGAVLTAQQAAGPANSDNPFFQEWGTPFGVPPFEKIRDEHFLPALQHGIAEQRSEVEAIARSSESPTFANTIEALDASGEFLDRVEAVFFNLMSAETNETLQQVAR